MTNITLIAPVQVCETEIAVKDDGAVNESLVRRIEFQIQIESAACRTITWDLR